SVVVQDSSGAILRVTHDFHPAATGADLYEVTVSIENVGTTVVQPNYRRALGWSAQPSADASTAADASTTAAVPSAWSLVPSADGQSEFFSLRLPLMEPGSSQVFRLYLGGAGDSVQAQGTLGSQGAALVSSTPLDTSTLVFGYAAGATPAVPGGA